MITQNGRQVGAIGLFALDEGAKLTRAGNSGFTSDKPAQPVLDFTPTASCRAPSRAPTSIRSQEMTKLIAVTRTFDGVDQ